MINMCQWNFTLAAREVNFLVMGHFNFYLSSQIPQEHPSKFVTEEI